MEALDIIRELCQKTNISISQLESELGYGNGSLAKAKNMSADRIYKIAQYFGVSMEYIMTGKTIDETDNEIALLRQQQSILININKINQDMTNYYKKINDLQNQLNQLKKDYNKIEAQKNVEGPLAKIPDDNNKMFDIPFDNDDLPFN